MSASVVGGAYFGGGLGFLADEGVDEGGFSDAGGADEGCGDAGGDDFLEFVDAAVVDGVGDDDGGVGGDGVDFFFEGGGVVDEIDLGEDEDGGGAAVEYGGHVALESSQVELKVEGCDDENDVEVCADDLHGGAFSGGLADELAVAWEDGDDSGDVVVVDVYGNPVADGGDGFGVVVIGASGAAVMCAAVALGGDDFVLNAVVSGYTGGNELFFLG